MADGEGVVVSCEETMGGERVDQVLNVGIRIKVFDLSYVAGWPARLGPMSTSCMNSLRHASSLMPDSAYAFSADCSIASPSPPILL